MKINNVLDFYNFIKNNGLINLNPETSAIYKCVEEYSRMCACDPPAARNAKLSQCRTSYINFAHRASQFKDVLLLKTNDSTLTFCIDGQVLVHLTR